MIEVAGDYRAELAGKGAGHPADTGTDLDQRALLIGRFAQAERFEIGRHLIITGRNAPQELIDYADLVTEMKEIKHPYEEQNISAQPGIEF